MKLSVIICTYNGGSRLPEVLSALATQQGLEFVPWELLVVDNASTDDTSVVLHKLTCAFPFNVRLLHESRPGKAHALRTAFLQAAGRYFCVVDDDNILDPEYLSCGMRFLDEHPETGFIAGRTLPSFPDNIAPPPDFDIRYADYLACRDKGENLIWGETPAGAGQMGRTFLMRGIYQLIGTRLEDRVGDGVGCAEDLEKGEISKRLGWRTAHVPGLRLRHVMSIRRLTPEYIDILTCAAIYTGPWLSLLAGREPFSVLWHTVQAWRDCCRSLKYRLLSMVPSGWHSKLKRAPFWHRFYRSRAKGYLSLILDRQRIRRMLLAIESSSHLLSPESIETDLANALPVHSGRTRPA